MGLPDTIKIGVFNYKVTEQPDLYSNGTNVLGVSNVNQLTIKLDSDVVIERRKQTLIHEILHVLIYEAGLSEKLQEHDVINPLANLLYRFMADNDLSWTRENESSKG